MVGQAHALAEPGVGRQRRVGEIEDAPGLADVADLLGADPFRLRGRVEAAHHAQPGEDLGRNAVQVGGDAVDRTLAPPRHRRAEEAMAGGLAAQQPGAAQVEAIGLEADDGVGRSRGHGAFLKAPGDRVDERTFRHAW